MSTKIEINKAAEIIKRADVSPEQLRQIVEEMNMTVQPEVDEEKPPAVKKQFVILVSDPDGRLPEGFDFAGWVLQIPENESVMTTNERINNAVYEFNTTRKGRLMPARTVGDALENVPSKHLKEQGVWVKTKTPVLVLKTDNEIPRETKE
jgi:phosphatidylethanolamine-binding protein (PEBP) family uncharacterized protein